MPDELGAGIIAYTKENPMDPFILIGTELSGTDDTPLTVSVDEAIIAVAVNDEIPVIAPVEPFMVIRAVLRV